MIQLKGWFSYSRFFLILFIVGLDFLADGGADFEHAITVTGKDSAKKLNV